MTDDETHKCSVCGREFEDRQRFIQGVLFNGQVISKGKRPRDDGPICGHEYV